MALPATDNFNRANGGVGANWTATIGGGQVVSNALQGTDFGYNSVYWDVDTFAADQYAQLVNLSISDGGPAVRISSGPKSYHIDAKAGNNVIIQKDVNGSFTNLQSGLTTPATNDVVYIEVVGTTIKLKINGVQVGTNATDSSLTAGSAGFWSYDDVTRVDDFLADNIGAAPVTGTGDLTIAVPSLDATGAVPVPLAIGQRIGGLRVV